MVISYNLLAGDSDCPTVIVPRAQMGLTQEVST